MKKILFALLSVIGIFILISTMPYYKTQFYKFSNSEPFSGSDFYNPYNNLGKTWIKANFHAHSRMHFGLANGENTPEEMYKTYDSMKYDLPCISNYNSVLPNIANRKLYIPAYEHGLNTGSIHQVVLNNTKANRFDFPYWQSTSHKQYIINDQKKADNLVILAHPSFKTGYSKKDLAVLNNYDLFEGMSVRANSSSLWDDALSTGHAVWVAADDDSHSTKFGVCGVCWNMVNVDSVNPQSIIQSLKEGKCYATRGWVGQEMNRIVSVKVDSNIYRLKLTHNSDSIILISDWGKTVAYAVDSSEISYKIQPENTYVRAEIYDTETWNTYTRIYLNPVLRTHIGKFTKHNNTTSILNVKTFIWKLLLLLFHITVLYVVFHLIKSILAKQS